MQVLSPRCLRCPLSRRPVILPGGFIALLLVLVLAAVSVARCTAQTAPPGADPGTPTDGSSGGTGGGTTGANLIRFTVEPSSVEGGNNTYGTATLDAPAPSGGQTLSIVSSLPSYVLSPPTITVPGGQSSVTFTIPTGIMTMYSSVYFAVLASDSNGHTLRADGTLLQTTVNLIGFSIDPSTMVGGNTATATLLLNKPAPDSGYPVSVFGGSPALTIYDGGQTVPAGQTSITFPIVTFPTDYTSWFYFQAYGWNYPVVPLPATLILLPPAGTVSVASVTLDPPIVEPGATSTGTVALSGPAPAGGAVVSLYSNTPYVATVPGSVMVPEGQTSATFPVTTSVNVDNMTTNIIATYGGTSQGANLLVKAGVGSSGDDGVGFSLDVRGIPDKTVPYSPFGFVPMNPVNGEVGAGVWYHITLPNSPPYVAPVTVTGTVHDLSGREPDVTVSAALYGDIGIPGFGDGAIYSPDGALAASLPHHDGEYEVTADLDYLYSPDEWSYPVHRHKSNCSHSVRVGFAVPLLGPACAAEWFQ